MSNQLPDATKLIAENARLRKLAEQNEQAADALWAERDRLREAAKKVRPAIAHRLRELRAKNDERSFQLTNDLAEFNAALQEAGDE